jgi:hypothetical protein
MAEAADRPTTSVTPTPRPSATDDVYRPVSLMALGAFLLAALFALLLAVGGAVALFGSTPLLMSLWVLGIPVVAALASWAARWHIRASEGTLSGTALTRWGIGISVVLGVVYVAYYLGTYVAIEQQATAIADKFMDLLKKGDIEQAYVLCLPPESQPPPGGNLRQDLEILFGEPRGKQPAFGQFRQFDGTRLVSSEGPGIECRLVDMVSWQYDAKEQGYKVLLRYHLKRPDVAFDYVVTVVGADPKKGGDGRQWHVLAGETRHDNLHLTQEGLRRRRCTQASNSFLRKWIEAQTENKAEEAWKGTLPPSQRKAAGEVLRRTPAVLALPVTGTGALGAYDAAQRDLLLSWLAFQNGSVVRAQDKVFYANPQQRPEILRAIEGLFALGLARRAGIWTPGQGDVPNWAEADGRIRVAHDFLLTVVNREMNKAEWTVSAEVVTEALSSEADKPDDWRLASVDLVTGTSGGSLRPGAAEGPITIPLR